MRRERGGARRREVGVEQQSSLDFCAPVRLAERLRKILDAIRPLGLGDLFVLQSRAAREI